LCGVDGLGVFVGGCCDGLWVRVDPSTNKAAVLVDSTEAFTERHGRKTRFRQDHVQRFYSLQRMN
jgi:hypothetical protein